MSSGVILEDYEVVDILIKGWKARDAMNAHAAAQLTREEGFCSGCATYAMKLLEGTATEAAKHFLCTDMRNWRRQVVEAVEVMRQNVRS